MSRFVSHAFLKVLCPALIASVAAAAPPQPPAGQQQKLSERDVKAAEMQLKPEEIALVREMALKMLLMDKNPLQSEEIQRVKEVEAKLEADTYHGPKPVLANRTITLSLAPGARPGKVVLVPGYVSGITFLDVTGKPWPIAMVSASDSALFQIRQPKIEPGNIMTVSALKDESNTVVNVWLKGQDRPVGLYLTSRIDDDPVGAKSRKKTGSRLKLRRRHDSQITVQIDRRGPYAEPLVLGKPITATLADEMQAFMDNTPPADAQEIAWTQKGAGLPRAWRWGGHMYVRTDTPLIWPAAIEIARQRDWLVYKLPVTDSIVISPDGEPLTLIVDD